MATQPQKYRGGFGPALALLSPFAGGGEMDRPDVQAGSGPGQQMNNYGIYPAQQREDKEFSEEERSLRDRAKKANRIYREACSNAGLKSCFFSDFAVWSDYVAGNMSDDDFHSHALDRARQMALDSEN